eukprot:3335908-Rhodomonas_salina.1
MKERRPEYPDLERALGRSTTRLRVLSSSMKKMVVVCRRADADVSIFSPGLKSSGAREPVVAPDPSHFRARDPDELLHQLLWPRTRRSVDVPLEVLPADHDSQVVSFIVNALRNAVPKVNKDLLAE